ncbi:MAG: type IV pili methyl-accepting chemotaxis transducer N-terminal domain-containing protein [Helicobacter sp.]|nr:type IV pili methyl-accepting chemotaxis transducer N-terminal domain-containing protein [Helicobacter sp.]
MVNIVTRLVVIGILVIICISVMIFSVIWINQRGIKDGYIINIVGKQRMLTQKIVKEIFIINAQNSKNFQQLDSAVSEFEENLKTLRFGNETMGIKPSNNKTIIDRLDSINTEWIKFRGFVEDFKALSLETYEAKKFLFDNNQRFLELSNNITQAMLKENLSAKIIDEAGQQGMLTQKMLLAFLNYTNRWDDVFYREFKESYELYSRGIEEFYRNPNYQKNPQVMQNIHIAYDFWQKYTKETQSLFDKQKKLIGDLKNIASLNNEILSQIDWTVNLYSDISIHMRAYLEKFEYVAAVIMIFLALYAIKILSGIHANFKDFTQKTKILAQRDKIDKNLIKSFHIEGNDELSLAAQNLSIFLNKINITKETSNRAKELSLAIGEEIEQLIEEIKVKLEDSNITESKRKIIQKTISLSEDIAIQSSEQLMVAAQLLDKLHQILQEIQEDKIL